MAEKSGGEWGRTRRSAAVAGATAGWLSIATMESNARPVGAGLFAAVTAVALWSWPHGAGPCEMCVPVGAA